MAWRPKNWNSIFSRCRFLRQTTTIQHSRSQTCYFTLVYVSLPLGCLAVARTWKNFHSFEVRFLPFSSYISVYILGSCKQFVRLHYAALFSAKKKKNTRKNLRQKLGKVKKFCSPVGPVEPCSGFEPKMIRKFWFFKTSNYYQIFTYFTQTWRNRQLKPSSSERTRSQNIERINFISVSLCIALRAGGAWMHCVLHFTWNCASFNENSSPTREQWHARNLFLVKKRFSMKQFKHLLSFLILFGIVYFWVLGTQPEKISERLLLSSLLPQLF